MTTFNIHEAKTHLSRLIEKVGDGEEVVIARAGKPVARLVAVAPATGRRTLGTLKGKLRIPKGFEKPLADEIVELFERG